MEKKKNPFSFGVDANYGLDPDLMRFGIYRVDRQHPVHNLPVITMLEKVLEVSKYFHCDLVDIVYALSTIMQL